MNITFLEDCPPVAQTGWSAYKKGDKATFANGAHLVEVGLAREGWEDIAKPITPSPGRPVKKAAPKKRTRKARTKK